MFHARIKQSGGSVFNAEIKQSDGSVFDAKNSSQVGLCSPLLGLSTGGGTSVAFSTNLHVVCNATACMWCVTQQLACGV